MLKHVRVIAYFSQLHDGVHKSFGSTFSLRKKDKISPVFKSTFRKAHTETPQYTIYGIAPVPACLKPTSVLFNQRYCSH